MNETEPVIQEIPQKWWRRYWFVLVILTILFVGVIGNQGWQLFQERQNKAHIAEIQAERAAKIEDEWGIRIIHVALVAEGGLLDLRYQVTDPDKAYDLFDAVETIPRVIAVDGTEMAMNDDPHTHNLEFGYQYFFLLRNIGGAVEPGSYVTVAVGDVELPFFEVNS
jgi:hypothetical protein